MVGFVLYYGKWLKVREDLRPSQTFDTFQLTRESRRKPFVFLVDLPVNPGVSETGTGPPFDLPSLGTQSNDLSLPLTLLWIVSEDE